MEVQIYPEVNAVANENADAANRVKLEFLSNIAHDFTTPISNILVRVEFIRNQVTDPNLLAAIIDIADMGNQMNRLVNDIRSFAQFDLVGTDSCSVLDMDFTLDTSTSRSVLAKEPQDLQSFCVKKGLSKRESQCIYYLVRGMTAKQIGKVTGLSNRTVEFYLDNAKSKLNCCSKFELITKIFENDA